MAKKNKILIIKTGYSEFLEKENNHRIISLGDILRTTPLLHLYKDDDVSWVTDFSAFPLLENNRFIKRLLPYDFTTTFQLVYEKFDTLINLEKVCGICALSNIINAWRKFGFRFDSDKGIALPYEHAFEVLAVSSSSKAKKENEKITQELLFEMVGRKWKGEEYIIEGRKKNKTGYDVGLNVKVGRKWPTKAWEGEKWNQLEEMLTNEDVRVSRQDKQNKLILEDLRSYIDWINSCKIIVSNDSLGLHLGIGLKKKVIGLFGPTPYKEVYFYERGTAIIPKEYPSCAPCFKSKCYQRKQCINDINVEQVHKKVMEYLNA